MKKGDKFPVIVAGVDTGQVAEVVGVDSEGHVTIQFPATQFIAATRTEIVGDRPVREPSSETIVTGVDRVENTPPAETGPVDIDKPESKTETVANAPSVETKTDATEVVTNGQQS